MDEYLVNQATQNTHGTGEVLTKAKRRLGFGLEELKWLGRVLISSADRFYWDNGFSKAASLAYSSLLSLVPLAALCFGIMASVISTGDNMTQVKEFFLKQFMPGGSAFDSILPLIEQLSAKLTSLNYLVISALIATCLLLLNSIEYTLNQVWQVYEARRITDRLAIFCAIIVLLPVFAVSGYYTSTKFEPLFADFGIVSGLYQDFIPFLVDSIAFIALYYLVPKAPVKFIPAIFGGCAASLLFGLAKHWFAFYLVRFSTYERVYESLALVPIFLIWLYVSWSIVLFGAEISYQTQHLPRRGKLWTRTLTSIGDGAMLLAVQSLVLVSRAFVSGKRIPNELEIAEALGCSSVVLKGSLDSLEKAGLIIRGDGRDMPLLLMKAPDAITLDDVREALFKKRDSMFFGKEMSKLYQYFSRDQKRGGVSLMDLINDGEG